MDDARTFVARKEAEGPTSSHLAAAAEPARRVGAVGYQRARLAGGPRGEAVADRLIDDATSRLFARFARCDSTEENLRLLWSYLEKFGRLVAFYTDRASLFCTAEKRRQDEPGGDKDRPRCRRRTADE